MYIIKNIVYSDPGKILTDGKFVGYSCAGKLDDFQEITLDLSTFCIKRGFIYINDLMIGKYSPNKTYAEYKTNIIKGRYTNDDQIAIMLNKDTGPEGLDRYNKMQEWRDWAATLANTIVNYK